MKKIKLALIGGNVEKSKSEEIHRHILRHFSCELSYEKFSLNEAEFEKNFPRIIKEFDGINITTPYKEKAIKYLNPSKKSELVRSVNTVLCKEKIGYTTDGWGFMTMLRYEGITLENKRLLIIGAGGAGRSIAEAVNHKAKVLLFRRNQRALKEDALRLGVEGVCCPQTCEVMVNCTGMVEENPISVENLKGCSVAVDLHYKTESRFLQDAKAEGKVCLDGFGMLFFQAYLSDCLFLKREPDTAEAYRLYQSFIKEYER